MNKVQLIGRLGKDPKGGVANGHVYSKFPLATEDYFYDQQGSKIEKTSWHRVTLWGKAAEFSNEYLFCGRLVYLEGYIQYRRYTDANGEMRNVTEIVARYVRALEPRAVHREHEQYGDLQWG